MTIFANDTNNDNNNNFNIQIRWNRRFMEVFVNDVVSCKAVAKFDNQKINGVDLIWKVLDINNDITSHENYFINGAKIYFITIKGKRLILFEIILLLIIASP